MDQHRKLGRGLPVGRERLALLKSAIGMPFGATVARPHISAGIPPPHAATTHGIIETLGRERFGAVAGVRQFGKVGRRLLQFVTPGCALRSLIGLDIDQSRRRERGGIAGKPGRAKERPPAHG